MSEYIGTVGQKITVEVTYKKRCEYTTHYTFYGETHNVFRLEDESGNCIIWNTTGWLEDKKFVNEDGMCKIITEGSRLLLTATVKEHSEYKGTKQTVISRPRFKLIELAKTQDEIRQEKIEAQKATIGENDFVWEMPYRQYKEHYSDCETIFDSFDRHEDRHGNCLSDPTIKVIIREGRLKKSGVRGEHYSGYEFTADDGTKVCKRAISEETALKRIRKEYPNIKNWELTQIYNYRDVHHIW